MKTGDPDAERLLAYADVGTYGLAHSLLAWGRCRVWCNRHHVPMLAPNWFHIQHRIGPILRRERDKRQYHLLFRFPGYVTGIRRAWTLLSAERIPAESANLEELSRTKRKGLVVFRNLTRLNEETHFHEIHGYGRDLLRDLRAITKPRFLPKPFPRPHVAMHVRMGDFASPSSEAALRQGTKNSRIPIEWYVSIINGLRHRLGPVAIRVISDGSDDDLAPLFALSDVTRTPRQPSISDLLSIADAQVVVSSGSGFSKWGAFLGNAPRICYPGQRLVRVFPTESAVDLEPECEDGVGIPSDFIELAIRRLSHSKIDTGTD